MAFLLTYPRDQVPPDLQTKLEALQPTFYCPCRVLTATLLTPTDQEKIRTSTDLVLTSQFGIHVYLQQLMTLNETATLHVLSKKAANYLVGRVANPIQIATVESQQGLATQLAGLGPNRRICWLLGNLAHRSESIRADAVMTIYRNDWPVDANQQVVQQLKDSQITQVLVTSPSNFAGLRQVQAKLSPETFSRATYYVLGHTSAAVIQSAQLPVVMPSQPHDVLRQMINKMCAAAE
ncbi:uroporphyrinogen-III synthase [Levilactobacillus yiduensis]|uniref:uroporphyrinogen-III synthase n=1 Tax=Levilactobacillus yiduensis TaxID=2953880 RepID=UPI000EF2B136|nr:uroporphyrinogen-III synthase [Levilactobacillus yiduensis]AYM02478.1 hypothetical protein D8911_05490 [Levilactobacillus brevis]